MIRILIADDQALIRGALVTLLGLYEDLEVIAEAATGAEAVEMAAAEGPDVVLLDVEMPVLDGLAACAAITAAQSEVAVLMVTTFGRPGYVHRALQAGARGFIVKDATPEQLVAAIRDVAAGRQVIDPVLALETLARGPSPLTQRETEVLRAFADGADMGEVARALYLSPGTLRNHVSAAIAKTGARSRSEAILIATESGWL